MISQTYTAAVLVAPGVIELEERLVPTLTPGEALIRVEFAGICGTDLALYSGSYPADLPMVPGHEFSGKVVAVGDSAHAAWLHTRVTAEINNTCLSWSISDLCPACANDLPHHCRKRTVLGIVGYDGVMAEMVRVPVLNLHALPDSITDSHGPFVEPLAAAIQTFELTPLTPGQVVVVLGAGRLGVLACKVAALKGARVVAVSRSPYKLQLARKFGAQVLVDAASDVRAQIKELTGNLGADVVVEATGTQDALCLAFDLVRPRGTICAKSTPGTNSTDFPLTRAVVDEITVQGSRCGPFGKAIRMMARHGLGMDLLVSDVYPLGEVQAAFEAAERKFKVLVRMT